MFGLLSIPHAFVVCIAGTRCEGPIWGETGPGEKAKAGRCLSQAVISPMAEGIWADCCHGRCRLLGSAGDPGPRSWR